MATMYTCVRKKDKAVFPYTPQNAAKAGMMIKTLEEAVAIMARQQELEKRKAEADFNTQLKRVQDEARGYVEDENDNLGILDNAPAAQPEPLKLAPEDPKPDEAESADDGEIDPSAPEHLQEMTKAQLVEYANREYQAKLDAKLNKGELIAQILELQAGV